MRASASRRGNATWHNVWMASHGRAIARKCGRWACSRHRSKTVRRLVGRAASPSGVDQRSFFLYGSLPLAGRRRRHDGHGQSGACTGADVRALMYLTTDDPARHLFSVTSGPDTLLAAGRRAGCRVPPAGRISRLTFTVWATSWLLLDSSVIGRLLHTLIGYTDRPTAAQLVVYLLTIALIVGLMRSQRSRHLAVFRAKRSSAEIASEHGGGIRPPRSARATVTN
jgi:high-affinity iron transporter